MWNHEVPDNKNPDLNANWSKTDRFVEVKALVDETVYPPESDNQLEMM
jgi:hypothetical protein